MPDLPLHDDAEVEPPVDLDAKGEKIFTTLSLPHSGQ